MSDYVSGLRQDLVEAAARQQEAGRAARVARPLRPRSWSPVAVLGLAATVAALVGVVVALRTVAPPPQPSTPKILSSVQIGGQPRDALLAAGSLWIADYEGRVVRLDPATRRVRARIGVGGTPMAIAADGDGIWVLSNESSPGAERSRLTRLDARTGRVLADFLVRGYSGDTLAAGAGGLWLFPDIHAGGLVRLDLRSHERTASVPKLEGSGLAATDRSVWTRQLDVVIEIDARGRVVNRVRGISPTLGLTSQRTLLPDADGAWVVGQSGGLLYRIEGGRVVRRVSVGATAGVIAGTRSAVWVSASPGVGRYELVRVDPDDGKVTGRLRLGSHVPQSIVPVGKDLWVVSSGGEAIRISPD
jgi:streptogramin lyase